MTDPEIFISGGPLTALEGARCSHASMIDSLYNKHNYFHKNKLFP